MSKKLAGKNKKWGGVYWEYIHLISFKYPDNPTENDITMAKKFINGISDIIPCDICANHFKTNLNKNKITDEILKSRMNFIKWTIDFHNVVNKMLNKKTYTFNESYKVISDVNNKKNIINCLDEVLKYVIYIIPYNINKININRDKIIDFIKTSLYLCNVHPKYNTYIGYKTVIGFDNMRKNVIKKILENK